MQQASHRLPNVSPWKTQSGARTAVGFLAMLPCGNVCGACISGLAMRARCIGEATASERSGRMGRRVIVKHAPLKVAKPQRSAMAGVRVDRRKYLIAQLDELVR